MKNFKTHSQNKGFALIGMTAILSIAFYSLILTSDKNTVNSKLLTLAIEDLDDFINYNRFAGILFKNRSTCVQAFNGHSIDPALLSVGDGIDFETSLGGGVRIDNRDLMVVGQKIGVDSGVEITQARLKTDPSVDPGDLSADEYATTIRFFAKRRGSDDELNPNTKLRGFGGGLTREIKLRMTITGNQVTDCFGVIQQDEVIKPEYSDLAFCRMIDPNAVFDPDAVKPVPKCQLSFLGIFPKDERTTYGEKYANGRIATHRMRIDRGIASGGVLLKRGSDLHKPCLQNGGTNGDTEGCPIDINMPEGNAVFGRIECDQDTVSTSDFKYLTDRRNGEGPPPAFITEDSNGGPYHLGCNYPYQLMDFTASSDPGSNVDGEQFTIYGRGDDYISVNRPVINRFTNDVNDYVGKCCRIVFN